MSLASREGLTSLPGKPYTKASLGCPSSIRTAFWRLIKHVRAVRAKGALSRIFQVRTKGHNHPLTDLGLAEVDSPRGGRAAGGPPDADVSACSGLLRADYRQRCHPRTKTGAGATTTGAGAT